MYRRLFWVTLGALILATPVLVWGVREGGKTMRNAPLLWIPAENIQRRQYEWFRNSFDVRDAAVVSWSGCTVDDPRLAHFTNVVSDQERRTPEGWLYRDLFEQVVSGQTLLAEFLGPPLELSRPEALERLEGVFVGPDLETSSAVVMFSELGMTHKAAAIAALRREAAAAGVEPEALRMAGSPVDSLAIDSASAGSMRYVLLLSGLLVMLLCRLCLGTWRFTFAVIAVAAFGEVLVLALVYFVGAEMNAVLTVMAPLVFVLTVSSGVHLVNYYRDQVRAGGQAGAARRALLAGWVPCTLAAVTTAIGMGSLVVSEMIPVQLFGALSAIGVLATAALLFLLMPGLMDRGQSAAAIAPAPQHPHDRAPSRGWHWLSAAIERRATWIALATLLTMIGCGWGLTWLRTSVNVLSLLSADSQLAQDYQWLETNVAPMVPIEVVVQFAPDCPLDLLQRLEVLRQAEREIGELDVLGGTLSAASFVPLASAETGVRGTVQRSVLRRRVDSQRETFQQAGYLYESDAGQAWRITARAPATMDVKYDRLMTQLQQQVEPNLAQLREQGFDVSAIYTGITPLVNVAQQMLLHDLIMSFLTALVLVAGVMMIVLRSVSAGLVAMLPNLLPTLLLFGGMGWLDQPVDIGSMMTASVALGIAIDGTLHYLTWFRREMAQGRPAREAVELSYGHCGNAMWQTAAICGLGLMVFAFSDFVPTQRFAWMMLLLLIAALVGDLLFLPALVMGPFRRMFGPARAAEPALEPEPESCGKSP